MPHIGELAQLQIDAMAAAPEYATRLDQDAATPTFAYFGKALPGTATSAATWQINKMVFGVDGDVTITWADGNSEFDNVWDNRAALTYT